MTYRYRQEDGRQDSRVDGGFKRRSKGLHFSRGEGQQHNPRGTFGESKDIGWISESGQGRQLSKGILKEWTTILQQIGESETHTENGNTDREDPDAMRFVGKDIQLCAQAGLHSRYNSSALVVV